MNNLDFYKAKIECSTERDLNLKFLQELKKRLAIFKKEELNALITNILEENVLLSDLNPDICEVGIIQLSEAFVKDKENENVVKFLWYKRDEYLIEFLSDEALKITLANYEKDYAIYDKDYSTLQESEDVIWKKSLQNLYLITADFKAKQFLTQVDRMQKKIEDIESMLDHKAYERPELRARLNEEHEALVQFRRSLAQNTQNPNLILRQYTFAKALVEIYGKYGKKGCFRFIKPEKFNAHFKELDKTLLHFQAAFRLSAETLQKRIEWLLEKPITPVQIDMANLLRRSIFAQLAPNKREAKAMNGAQPHSG